MTFNNSILSGTVLARENIQSEGFVAGSSGWIVERDGDAEFNSIVVRGSVTSVGAIYTANIFDGRMNIFLNSDTDQVTEWSPGGLLFHPIDGTSGLIMDYDEPNAIGFRVLGGDTQGVYFDRATKFLYKTEGAGTYTPEVWKTVPGANGYTGGEYKLLPDGNVILDGNFAGGAAVSPVIVGTLPAGYRPRAYTEYMVARGGAFGTNKLTVGTNGDITQWTADATYNSFASGLMFSTLA